MGRLSKKAIQEKKEAKTRYIISLAIQSLVGAVIFSLLLFIIVRQIKSLKILLLIAIIQDILLIFHLVNIKHDINIILIL